MRILLADDESNVRFALRALLERLPGVRVVGEAADLKGLLSQIEIACPDLVLLDWELRGSAAADLLPALRRLCPDLAVIVLSGQPEARRAALATGANAFVGKTDPPEELMAALQFAKRAESEECTKES
jgi:DNA-binding NarL/FixJ family response regulator